MSLSDEQRNRILQQILVALGGSAVTGGGSVDNTRNQILAAIKALISGSPLGAFKLRVWGGTPGRKPLAAEVIFNVPMKTGDAFPANLSGSLLKINTNVAGIAPTGSWTITLKKNSTTFSTGTISAAGTSGSYSACAAQTFVDGDFFSGTAITPQDATATDVEMIFIGTKTQ